MLVSVLVMLCFTAGYAAMSRRVKETGAFYAYITKGLGRPTGGAGAYLALLNYIVCFCCLAGGFGYFAGQLVLQLTGLDIPWWVLTLIAIAIIGLLCSRNIDVGAKVQVGLLIIEIAMMIIIVIATVFKGSHGDLLLRSLSPSTILTGGWRGFSIGLMFSFFLFGGVELAAVYAEETPNPERTVGRATYGAVLAIGILYIIMISCIIAVVGANVQDVAMENLGHFSFDVIGRLLGPSVQTLVSVLVLTSYLASMIGFQQVVARYILAMGRDNLLPRSLAYVDPVHKAPQRANLVSAVTNIILMLLFALSSSDPFRTIFASLSGLCTLTVMSLWIAVSVAFIVYFRRHADPRWMSTLVLPLVALMVFGTTFVLVVKDYTLLTGSDIAWINNLPWIMVPVSILGIWRMLYLRSKKPEVYALIWPDEVDTNAITKETSLSV